MQRLNTRGALTPPILFPSEGVVLHEKTPRLNYDVPILVDKWEWLAKLIHDYLTRHIKPRSILQCVRSWKLGNLQSSRKIGNATFNAEKYNCWWCSLEGAVTLPNSDQTHTFSGLSTYDFWSVVFILYQLIFGSQLCNFDSQQINSLLSVFIYHWFHSFEIFMFFF